MGFVQRITESGKAIQGMLAIAFSIIVLLLFLGNLTGITGTKTVDGGDVQDSTFVLTNASYTAYANSSIVGLKDIACSLYNFTNSSGEVMDATNYTLGSTGNCYVIGADGSEWNGSTMNATYSFTYNSFTDPDGVINNFTSGALTFATYAPTIFTALAIVLLIAVFLILYQYVGGKKGGSGGFAE